MSETRTEHSEKSSEGFRLMPTDVASRLLHEIAEPRPVGDTVKAAITRAANAMNQFLPKERRVSYGRAEDIWRREARRIDAAEMDAIRSAHEHRNRTLREELRAAAALADRLERLAAQAIPSTDLAALDEVVSTARQAKRTARALRDLAAAERRGL
ncbi:hypothetical protein ACFQE0_26070 [Methylobacterium komagatae]|uniref:KfrA N-terminal DNA-binding domain-containing protein n=1 Tax=Methylobacterium komagatae TaxID=374425 RepID=A0ABW2BT21_9HYPH